MWINSQKIGEFRLGKVKIQQNKKIVKGRDNKKLLWFNRGMQMNKIK